MFAGLQFDLEKGERWGTLVEEVAQVKIGDGLGMGGRSGDRPTAIGAAAEERDGIVNKLTERMCNAVVTR